MELAHYLDHLHLGSYEKAAILFLAGVESASATDLVKHAHIPQGRVYSVLNGLKAAEIVQAIPTSPKRYAVQDVRASLRRHLEREREALAERQEQLSDVTLAPKALPDLRTPSSVAVFNGREEHLAALAMLRSAAREELAQIAPLFSNSFASMLALRQALVRGVRVRIIILGVTKENRRHVQQAMAAGAHVRVSRTKELLGVALRDGQEFLLGVHDYRRHEERLTLLGRNPGLLQALQHQFEEEWAAARPLRRVRA